MWRIELEPVDRGIHVLGKPVRSGLCLKPSREERHERFGRLDAGSGKRAGKPDRRVLVQSAAGNQRIERRAGLAQEPLAEAAAAYGIEARALDEELEQIELAAPVRSAGAGRACDELGCEAGRCQERRNVLPQHLLVHTGVSDLSNLVETGLYQIGLLHVLSHS